MADTQAEPAPQADAQTDAIEMQAFADTQTDIASQAEAQTEPIPLASAESPTKPEKLEQSTPTSLSMTLEDAFHSLGKFGKYQIITYLLVGLTFGLTGTWQLFVIIFIGYINPHHCKTKVNETHSVPEEEGSYEGLAKCLQYTDEYSNQTTTCTNGYEYSLDGFTEKGTITMQWDLVCDKDKFVELSQTLFNVGVMCGFLFFTPLADRFGRKKIFFIGQFVMAIFGIVMAFSPTFEVFCVCQFITGACVAAVYMTGLVLACEMFPISIRATVAPLTTMFAVAGYITLGGWAFIFNNWRHLQLAISVAGAVFLIYFFWCPESVRWLLVRGKKKEALGLLNIAAKVNGKNLPEDLDLTDNIAEGADKTPSLLPYFKNLRCLRYFVIMTYVMSVNNLMFFGLSLMMGALPGSIQLNFLIVGLLDIPAISLAIVCAYFIGRRWPICVFQILAGLTMASAAAVIPFEFANIDKDWLVTGLAFVARFFVGATYNMVTIYAQEILPTNIRGTGLGIMGGLAFIGSISAPFAVYLYRQNPWISNAILAVLTVIAGLLTPLEPETTGRDLPTTVEEIANWTLALTPEEKQAYREKKKAKKDKKKSKNANTNAAYQA